MKIEGYIAKNIKIGIYEPAQSNEKQILLIIETENDFPTIAPLTEADIDELIAEIQSRRRQFGTPSFFRRFRERWRMLKNKQTRLR